MTEYTNKLKSSSFLSNSSQQKNSKKSIIDETSRLSISNKIPYLAPLFWKELIRLEEDFKYKKFDFQSLNELIQFYSVKILIIIKEN